MLRFNSLPLRDDGTFQVPDDVDGDILKFPVRSDRDRHPRRCAAAAVDINPRFTFTSYKYETKHAPVLSRYGLDRAAESTTSDRHAVAGILQESFAAS